MNMSHHPIRVCLTVCFFNGFQCSCSYKVLRTAQLQPLPRHRRQRQPHALTHIHRRWLQPPTPIDRPVGMEPGQVKEWRVHFKRALPVPLEIGVHLVPIRAREKLDRGALGVGVGVDVGIPPRRLVSKVEPTWVCE